MMNTNLPTIGIIGGSGAIAREAMFAAQKAGNAIVVITRDPEDAYRQYMEGVERHNKEVAEGKRTAHPKTDINADGKPYYDVRSLFEFAVDPSPDLITDVLPRNCFVSEYENLEHCDAVICCVAKKIPESKLNRNEFLNSCPVVYDVAKKMRGHLKEGVLVTTVTNPVETQGELLRLLLPELKRDQISVIGTTVDTARNEFFWAQQLTALLEPPINADESPLPAADPQYEVRCNVYGLHRTGGHLFDDLQMKINDEWVEITPELLFGEKGERLASLKKDSIDMVNINPDLLDISPQQAFDLIKEELRQLTINHGYALVYAKKDQGFKKAIWDAFNPGNAAVKYCNKRLAGEPGSTQVSTISLDVPELAQFLGLEESEVSEIVGENGRQFMGVPTRIQEDGSLEILEWAGDIHKDTALGILRLNDETMLEAISIMAVERTEFMHIVPDFQKVKFLMEYGATESVR